MKAICLVLMLACVFAEFTVSPAIGSHMILQRAPNHASIYGKTDLDDKVVVYLEEDPFPATIEEDGRWRVLLPPHEADKKPYTLTITSEKYNRRVVFDDILFGDVWLCSGQSNMEMTVKMSFNAEEAYEDAPNHPDMRLFSISHNEQDTDRWDDLTPEIVQLPWSAPNATTLGRDAPDWSFFSAACWYFGVGLHRRINVPIGLISTSWGGTIIEAWSDPDVYTVDCPNDNSEFNYENLYNPDSNYYTNDVGGPNEHRSSLWNGMLYPFIRTTIKGAIWYHGTANEWNVGSKEKKSGYACRFPAMIASWRKFFSQMEGTTDPLFPFGFISITSWCESTCDPANQKPDTWYGPAAIRWAQQVEYVDVPNPSLPNVFMAMDYDLEDINVPNPPYGQIHARDKMNVGDRLALAAANQIYGLDMTSKGPVLDSCKMSSANDTIEIFFDKTALNGEYVAIKQTFGYEVEINDSNNWYNVDIVKTTSDNSILIDTHNIREPITGLRYAWRNDPCCPLLREDSKTVACVEKSCAVYTSESDLPATPFTVKIANNQCIIPK